MDFEQGLSANNEFPEFSALAALEPISSSIRSTSEDFDTEYDQATSQFVNVKLREANAARQKATSRKDNFVKVLTDWDTEHDKIAAETANRVHRNLFNRNRTLVAEVRSNISNHSSWKDVFDSLRIATDDYNNPTGIRVVRKWLRGAADKAEFVEPFVGLIPDTEFTSVICTGLRFILEACKAAKKFREEAFDLVDKLPRKIDLAGQYLEVYSLDPQLQIATNNLQSSILWAIEGLMVWLTKGHEFEWLKPLVLQDKYDPLKGRIAQVEESSKLVEEAVNLCASKKICEIGRNVEQSQRTLNEALDLLRGQYVKLNWFVECVKRCHQIQHEQGLQSQAYATKKELLSLLVGAVDSDKSIELQLIPSALLREVLQIGFSMDTENQNRSKWLMSDRKIGHWLRSSRSRKLQINGNSTFDRVSPISFFCGLLIQSLKPVDSIVILSYFCGLTDPKGSNARPQRSGSSGLLRSLLTQLIKQWKFGKIKCLTKEDLEQLKRSGPELSLRDEMLVFRKLVAALPESQPLFIIVDGISYYEEGEYKTETKGIVSEVNALLRHVDVKAMMKVFVSSPTRSFEVKEYFEEYEIIEMPSNISGTMAGFADLQFSWNLGDDVTQLEGGPH